jgi:hypothetical protein
MSGRGPLILVYLFTTRGVITKFILVPWKNYFILQTIAEGQKSVITLLGKATEVPLFLVLAD